MGEKDVDIAGRSSVRSDTRNPMKSACTSSPAKRAPHLPARSHKHLPRLLTSLSHALSHPVSLSFGLDGIGMKRDSTIRATLSPGAAQMCSAGKEGTREWSLAFGAFMHPLPPAGMMGASSGVEVTPHQVMMKSI